ncbi:PREDICTED: uncharacterized protein LOC105459951 [Wasmannia auropunctata]|uniref:uncharacterized protein LOC105459951 n=1 Tax=Wasmannia auropunctata TaxID=64793 RepID=UPI0005F03598|nr:PREDICTED: uncharacterized protein LOC105459951 [Wasmannia auropunctata]
MIADDWLKTKIPQEKAMMIARAQIARIIITCGFGLMGFGFVVIVILPIFGHSVRYLSNITDLERPLPIQAYYIYDATKSPQYELTFTSQGIALIFSAISYTGIDNFLSLSVFHISGQLDILRDRLLHLHNNANYKDVLKNCVIKHVRLLS